jgi:hypothetical protein
MRKAALPHRPANNIDKGIAESVLFQNVVARPSLFELICCFRRLFEGGPPGGIGGGEIAVESSRDPPQTAKPKRHKRFADHPAFCNVLDVSSGGCLIAARQFYGTRFGEALGKKDQPGDVVAELLDTSFFCILSDRLWRAAYAALTQIDMCKFMN